MIRETATIYDTLKVRDTLRLENERVQVELIKMPGEKVFLKGTCKGDTVHVYNDKIVEKITQKADKKQEFAVMAVIGVLGMALLGVIWRK